MAMAAETAVGTRRSVIRSQKFMEWQSDLISTRAAYSTRRRSDDAEGVGCNGSKKNIRKRSSIYGNNAKSTGSPLEREREAELDAISSQESFKKKNIRRRELHQNDSESKNVVSESNEGGPLPTSKGQDGIMSPRLLQTIMNQSTGKRKQRRIPRQYYFLKERITRGSRTKEQEISLPPDLETGRGSKRTRKVAEKLAQEEPPPPPLKLPKLQLVLSRKEIHEDWVKITGHKYHGKPRKSTLSQWGLGLCTSLTSPSTIRYLTGLNISRRVKCLCPELVSQIALVQHGSCRFY